MKGRESIGRDISSLSITESHRTRRRSELRICLVLRAQSESTELDARLRMTTSTLTRLSESLTSRSSASAFIHHNGWSKVVETFEPSFSERSTLSSLRPYRWSRDATLNSSPSR